MANVAVTGETLAGAALTTTDTVSAPAEGRAVIGAAGSVLFASDTVLWPEAVLGGIAYANPTSDESAKLLAETRFEAELDITVIPSLSGLVQTHFVAAAQISVPDSAPTVKLGCGLYEVWVLERGGKAIRSLPDVVSINFNRVLNGVSEASVVVGVPVGRVLTEEACRAVADLNPWSHEIAIYRGIDGQSGVKQLVWVGPIRRIEIDSATGEVFITAKDLFSWFDRRFYRGEAQPNAGIAAQRGQTIPDLDTDETDLSYIWEQVTRDALLPDNPNIVVQIPTVTSVTGSRFVSRGQYRYVGDLLREIANQGIDYTTVNRTIRAGGTEIRNTTLAILVDTHFAVPPRLIIDGDSMATRWVVGGGGTGQEGPDEAGDTALDLVIDNGSTTILGINPIDPVYGLLEQYVFEPAIEDNQSGVVSKSGSGRPSYPYFNGSDSTDSSDSIYNAATTRYNLNHEPYTSIEGGQLSADAPVDFGSLIPGAVLGTRLNIGCRVSTTTQTLIPNPITPSGPVF